MKRSFYIIKGENSICIKKNRREKIIILSLSIFAESFFYYILFKNIFPSTKNGDNTKYALILLLIISLIFLLMLILSIRNYVIDKDYRIEKGDGLIIINGIEKFKTNNIRMNVNDVVNRWGTKTYNINLKGDDHSLKIMKGINKEDLNYLIENLSIFLSNANTTK